MVYNDLYSVIALMLVSFSSICNSPACFNVCFIVQIFLCETLPMEYLVTKKSKHSVAYYFQNICLFYYRTD